MKALLLLCIVLSAVLAQNNFETIDITYEDLEQSTAPSFLSVQQQCAYCCAGKCCLASSNCRNGVCNAIVQGTCTGTG